MPEIIILAMAFIFVALRLWSVLGRRTGHEHQPVTKPLDVATTPGAILRPKSEPLPQVLTPTDTTILPEAAAGVRSIIEADRSFDPARFLEGAKSAYRMILEAFWRGDEEELGRYVEQDVRDAFFEAIADRKEQGYTLENRLVRIDRAVIASASLNGRTATVTVQFDADIAAVTRDTDGHVIAGSLTDAVPTHDAWTFSRTVGDSDPNWILVETDEAA